MSDVYSNRLKELRDIHGYTQKQVADFLGIDQSNLSKIERSVRNLNLSILNKLCSLYGCTPEYILCESDDYSIPNISFRLDETVDLNAISKLNQVMEYLLILDEINDE